MRLHVKVASDGSIVMCEVSRSAPTPGEGFAFFAAHRLLTLAIREELQTLPSPLRNNAEGRKLMVDLIDRVMIREGFP